MLLLLNKNVSKDIKKITALIVFMLTIGTVIHEEGHALAVRLTGGDVFDIRYELTRAYVVYRGGNEPIITLCGPICGIVALLLFGKKLSMRLWGVLVDVY